MTKIFIAVFQSNTLLAKSFILYIVFILYFCKYKKEERTLTSATY